MANSNQQVDPQLLQILDLLGKFGFKFFGYNEAKEPLVIAQNGQVVTVSIAYNFVQTQMAKASAAASLNGPESMPQMPQTNLNQMPASPESKVETKVEQGMEKKDKENFGLENMPKLAAPQASQSQSKQAAPAPTSPFGDGFKVTSFDPGQIDQTIEFVKKSSNLKQTSPRKYLALQFEKFLSEIKLANKK